MSKKVAVVFSITNNLMFAVANVIYAIEKYSPNFVDNYFVFLDSYADASDMERVQVLSDYKTRFRLLDQSQYQKNKENINMPKYSIMCFGIFESFILLKQYNNVIFLDPDLLVQADISGILSDSYIKMSHGRLSIEQALGRVLPEEQIIHGKKAFNSGVVVLNSNLLRLADPEKIYSDCIKYTNLFWDTLVFPDQAILSFVLYKNQIPIDLLDWKYNSTIMGRKNFWDSKIIHSVGGKSKFWNNGITNLMFSEWNRNHQKWLDLGGKDFTGPRYYWKIRSYSKKELFDIIKYAVDNGYQM